METACPVCRIINTGRHCGNDACTWRRCDDCNIVFDTRNGRYYRWTKP